jgi:hypothetical protein
MVRPERDLPLEKAVQQGGFVVSSGLLLRCGVSDVLSHAAPQ